jgi:hypothetical protein
MCYIVADICWYGNINPGGKIQIVSYCDKYKIIVTSMPVVILNVFYHWSINMSIKMGKVDKNVWQVFLDGHDILVNNFFVIGIICKTQQKPNLIFTDY